MSPEEQADHYQIFRCVTGSRAYGTSSASSDLDVRGVFAAEPLSLMTPFFPVTQVDGPGDTVLFELMKYVRLVCDQNPNIVELLWVDPSDVLFDSPAWRMLRDRRGDLLTTRVRTTYGGFATQALKQMKGRDRWLNKPQPVEPPRPCDFVSMAHNMSLGREFNSRVPDHGQWTAVGIGQDLYLLHEGGSGGWRDASGNLRTFTRQQAASVMASVPPSALVRFDRKNYEERKRDHVNYWTWKRERNPDRGALEERMGFDGKNAAHLIRLLRTAREILTDGIVRVRRPDAAELLSIRNGEVCYERVVEMAEELDASLGAAEASSGLPGAIDQEMLGGVVMGMYERAWADAFTRTKVALPGVPFSAGGAPDTRGRVVVVDVEMTGFAETGRNQIVEIGAVEILGGRTTGRTFHAYVDPRAPLNRFGTRVHGLTAGFLSGKPTFAEIAPTLLAFFGDAPLVAHGAETDVRAMNNDLVMAGLAPLSSGRVACTGRLAQRLLGVSDMSLDSLCDALSVDRAPRSRGHAASLDAALDAECLLSMANLPGYGNAQDVWIKRDMLITRAERRRAGHEAGLRDNCVAASLSGDGRHAMFRLGDGRVLEDGVPGHPPETHHAVVAGRGAVAIVRTRPEAGEGRLSPDNPDGPALLVCRKGSILALWFEDGARVAPRDGSCRSSPGP